MTRALRLVDQREHYRVSQPPTPDVIAAGDFYSVRACDLEVQGRTVQAGLRALDSLLTTAIPSRWLLPTGMR